MRGLILAFAMGLALAAGCSDDTVAPPADKGPSVIEGGGSEAGGGREAGGGLEAGGGVEGGVVDGGAAAQ